MGHREAWIPDQSGASRFRVSVVYSLSASVAGNATLMGPGSETLLTKDQWAMASEILCGFIKSSGVSINSEVMEGSGGLICQRLFL